MSAVKLLMNQEEKYGICHSCLVKMSVRLCHRDTDFVFCLLSFYFLFFIEYFVFFLLIQCAGSFFMRDKLTMPNVAYFHLVNHFPFVSLYTKFRFLKSSTGSLPNAAKLCTSDYEKKQNYTREREHFKCIWSFSSSRIESVLCYFCNFHIYQ